MGRLRSVKDYMEVYGLLNIRTQAEEGHGEPQQHKSSVLWGLVAPVWSDALYSCTILGVVFHLRLS
jgi:hypothetical protein